MGQVGRASRARWLAAFTLLLFVATCIPVLAEVPGRDGGEVTEVPAAEGEGSLPTGADLAQATAKLEKEEEQRERELASPAAEEEREESQTAYEEVDSVSQASELLRSTFQAELTSLSIDPARFISDTALKESLPEGGAVVYNEGEPEIVESEVPARVRDESGAMGKVDLGLDATSEGFVPTNPVVDLTIPPSAQEAIEIENGTTTIAQAGANPQSSAHFFDDKDVIYPEIQTDTDLLVSPLRRRRALRSAALRRKPRDTWF